MPAARFCGPLCGRMRREEVSLLRSLLLHILSSDASLKTKSHNSMAAPGCLQRPTSFVLAKHTSSPTSYPCIAWRPRNGGATTKAKGEEISISSAVCLRFFAGVELSRLHCISSMTGAASIILTRVELRFKKLLMYLFRNNIDWCVLNRVVFGGEQVNYCFVTSHKQPHFFHRWEGLFLPQPIAR